MACKSVTPVLGRDKTGGSWSWLDSRSRQTSELEFSEKPCFKALLQRAMEKGILKVLHLQGHWWVSTHAHASNHMCTHDLAILLCMLDNMHGLIN